MGRNFYGDISHKGVILGNLVKATFGFNCIYWHIYVYHRICQKTSIKGEILNTMYLGKNHYKDYDLYTLKMYTKGFSDEMEAFHHLADNIHIYKYVDMNNSNNVKKSEEILRILG